MAEHTLVSIIVPIYDEASTLEDVVQRLMRLTFPHEILLVDDGSSDGTTELVRSLASNTVRAFRHSENRGKGAAIRTALAHAIGEVIVIQDADLEYDSSEIEQLIEPILKGRADAVYGSRFTADRHAECGFQRRTANQFLTWLSNCFTGLRLTDMETCYKAMRREVTTSFVLRENRFGIEPELTAKIARGGWRITELPVSYCPRDYAAGKKIGVRDGVRAIWCILRYSRWD